tara:strand:+ start:18518 stop:18640 length:123 start_codon:yes stop_codon:yes gene_type:complete
MILMSFFKSFDLWFGGSQVGVQKNLRKYQYGKISEWGVKL